MIVLLASVSPVVVVVELIPNARQRVRAALNRRSDCNQNYAPLLAVVLHPLPAVVSRDIRGELFSPNDLMPVRRMYRVDIGRLQTACDAVERQSSESICPPNCDQTPF